MDVNQPRMVQSRQNLRLSQKTLFQKFPITMIQGKGLQRQVS